MRIAAFVIAATLATPALAQNAKTADVLNSQGEEIGTIQIRAAGEGILISAEISGLPAGPLGFHIHENGTCEGDFESAGGHFNPDGKDHGYLAENGPHAGDMPNQPVDADGNMVVDVFNPNIDFETVSGLALMLHDGSDDYLSDPTGHAGGRLACAAIP